MIETISRQEWLRRNPILHRYMEESVVGWGQLPGVNLWPDCDSIEGISQHQRDNLRKALTNRIGILGGSPGTGKTWTVSKLIRTIILSGSVAPRDIAVAAPTGKATVRLNEMLQAEEMDIRARTCHSHLGVGETSLTGTWSFRHNESSPFPYRIVIVDEGSMKDMALMLGMMRARPQGCHFLIVGDVNQLPPVGAGAPLRDMIAAGLPYGELIEIQRNSGGIVEACAAIRDGLPWVHLAKNATNIQFTHSENDSDKIRDILNLITKSETAGYDPVWDCQVLVAVNEDSKLSRRKINDILQDELNPSPKVEGTKFRVKDKIVCLKNGFFVSIAESMYIGDFDDSDREDIQRNDRGEVYVANGELAEVIGIHGGRIVARLDKPSRVVVIPFRKPTKEGDESESESNSVGAAANWDLGYALSVHKSQGSEWPVVITILDAYPGARMVCDRAWIYTAISRARDKQYLVGPTSLAERFCRVAKIHSRKTFLKELIAIEHCKYEMMGI